MLEIVLPEFEVWNNEKEEFIASKGSNGKILQLEHSLISIKKWESKWHKPFLGKEDKTYEELCDYVRCMTLNHGIPDSCYTMIEPNTLSKIVDYIQDPMTATWFSKEPDSNGAPRMSHQEVITAEIIYYWMIALNVPSEYQKWHLNQLLTLIKVLNIKNTPPKKMSKRDLLKQHAAINAARRAKYNSKG